MSYPFGITGIGYNPYMSGLGTFGLPTGGTYSSYVDPTMMMGGYGMMGMYNPAFMKNTAQAYQEIEKSQLSHASAMHELMLQNKTHAYKAEDNALFQKSMEDANLRGAIQNLADKVKESDTDGICQEFDKLKVALYRKHNDYLRANSDRLNPSDSVNYIIEQMYAQLVAKNPGATDSLRKDIEKYCDNAFEHGFNKTFLGKKEYHENYSDETLSYLFGTRIDNKGGKDRMEKIGSGVAHVAEGAAAAAAGALALPLAATTVKGVLSSITPEKISSKIAKCSTFNKKIAWLGAFVALGADVIWQMSRD